MATEGFKKEQEILRMLFLYGGAYNRRQFAEKLGMGQDNLDKTIRSLKEVFGEEEERIVTERDGFVYNRIRHDSLQDFHNYLAKFYAIKSLRAKEKFALLVILKILAKQAEMTIREIASAIDEGFYQTKSSDEKTVKKTLMYWERLGIVKKQKQGRAYTYSLQDDMYAELSTAELSELCDYIEYKANTATLSAQGYMTAERTQAYLRERHGAERTPIFAYKYNYFGKILDEYICHDILAAIEDGCSVQISYYPRYAGKRYKALNTNPIYEEDERPDKQYILAPLRLVYDEQYGRWHLIAKEKNKRGLKTFRVENIGSIKQMEAVDKSVLDTYLLQTEEENALSWVVQSGAKPTQVKIRFHYDKDRGTHNFIRARVEREKRNGTVIDEDPNGEWFDFVIAVNGDKEIRPWIYSFGSGAEVLEPQSLRAEMIAYWQEVAKRYEK